MPPKYNVHYSYYFKNLITICQWSFFPENGGKDIFEIDNGKRVQAVLHLQVGN